MFYHFQFSSDGSILIFFSLVNLKNFFLYFIIVLRFSTPCLFSLFKFLSLFVVAFIYAFSHYIILMIFCLIVYYFLNDWKCTDFLSIHAYPISRKNKELLLHKKVDEKFNKCKDAGRPESIYRSLRLLRSNLSMVSRTFRFPWDGFIHGIFLLLFLQFRELTVYLHIISRVCAILSNFFSSTNRISDIAIIRLDITCKFFL